MFSLLLFLCCGDKTLKVDVDNDNDGYNASVDCNDSNSNIHPNAPEQCDDLDNDCDGHIDNNLQTFITYLDNDGDGYGAENGEYQCRITEGYVTTNGDCNDNDDTIYPYTDEICDGIDNDCNDQIDDQPIDGIYFYHDTDNDGYGNPMQQLRSCQAPENYVDNALDCDDTLATVNPSSIEICDNIDNDCDSLIDDADDSLDPFTATSYYEDIDGDGYGDPETEILTCTQPGDYVDNGLDCDDSTIWISPDFTFDGCDGIDNDCDGNTDEDVKPSWPLVTIHEFLSGMAEIDTNTANIGTVHPLSGIGGVFSMDVSETGIAAIHSNYGGARIAFLDACNNQVTFLAPHNISGIGCGISFGPNGNLYAINAIEDALYQMDTTTGQGTFVGYLGVDIENCGIAYDCANDVLLGATSSTDQIFRIDHQTGAAYDFLQTTVPLTISVGMAFQASTNSVFLATELDIYQVDLTTGNSTYIGATGNNAAWNINDLAFYPPCP